MTTSIPSRAAEQDDRHPMGVSSQPGAIRTQRYRQRRRDRDVLVKLWLDAAAVDDLTSLGWVKPGADADAVRQAMLEVLIAALDRGIRPSVTRHSIR